MPYSSHQGEFVVPAGTIVADSWSNVCTQDAHLQAM